MTFVDATSRTEATGAPRCEYLHNAQEASVDVHAWVSRRMGSWRWTTRDDWSHRLHENGCPDWLRLTSGPHARLIKANDGRQVWRVEVDGRLVFVKLYQPPRGWVRLRHLLIGSDSIRERRVAEYARRHRIRTVQPVASADGSTDGPGPVSILITEGLPGAVPLNEFWSALNPADRPTRTIKNHVIDSVARLVAHAHQNGFEHTDLHAGNILMDGFTGETHSANGHALFVDLHNIRVGRPVGDRGVVRNLAQFHQWFRSRAPMTDRVRFLQRYLHWRDAFEATSAYGRGVSHSLPEMLAAIERAAQAHANGLYAQRDRRTTRTGRYFTRLTLGHGWRGYAFLACKHPVPGSSASTMTFTPKQWRDCLQQPREWLSAQRSQYAIKKSASGLVCRSQLSLDNRSVDVICKRSMPRHLGKRVQNFFRESRGMRTWRLANALLNRQIPTARPLAVVERRRCGMLLDNIIVTEHIEHAHDLDTVLTVQIRDLQADAQYRLKQQIAQNLARLVRAFHARGFIHRDFKAPNVMVQWDPAGHEPPQLLLVDLDGIRPCRRPSRRYWLRALMRLNVSLDHCRKVSCTDRLRFLKACLIRPGNPEPQWKEVWRDIERLSARKRTVKTRQFERMMAKYGRI